MSRNIWKDKRLRAALIFGVLFLAAFIVKMIYFTALDGILMYPDSYEYIASATGIKSFEIDASRVPIYPLFILIARNLFRGFTQETAVVVVQAITASAALAALYYICTILFKGRLKALIIFAFSALSISLLNWDFLILTESLTITFITFLLLGFTLYIKTERKQFLIFTYIMCLLLIYLKPFYLLLPLLVAAITAVKGFTERKWKNIILIGTAALVLTYSSILAYSYANYRQNGYFGISNVSIINRFGKVLQYGMYEYGENEEINDAIRTDIAKNGGMLPAPNVFISEHGLTGDNYSEISEYVSGIIKKHPYVYIKRTLVFVRQNLLSERYFIDYNRVYANDNYQNEWPVKLYNMLNNIPSINTFAFIFAFVLAEIILLVLSAVRNHRFEWVWTFMTLTVAYQLGMSILGSHGEYHRLMAPAYVFTILIIFNLIYKVIGLFARKRRIISV